MSALTLALCSMVAWADAPKNQGLTVFIDVEWRGMALADHLSHGPGVGVAVGLLDDHLRVGIHGLSRPGPMNTATFTLTPEAPYKGQDQIELRSDGGLLGPSLQVGADLNDTLRVDLGAMVGYGGFGFYLVDEDRETPDGRLPSAWENELMDGRDSSLGIGMDIGPRITWTRSEHVRPYLAARYTTIFAYDAFIKPDYDGFSIALGLSVGRF
ncbi:MAG: hypothetical protein AAFV53_34280 [Myxococcota bacterium]